MNKKSILQVALNKSKSTPCRFNVCAICYDRRGRLLGITSNIPRFSKKGGGVHAEMMALQKWGTRIKKMTIVRFGGSNNLLPIQPCSTCKKVLRKLKIKISEQV